MLELALIGNDLTFSFPFNGTINHTVQNSKKIVGDEMGTAVSSYLLYKQFRL